MASEQQEAALRASLRASCLKRLTALLTADGREGGAMDPMWLNEAVKWAAIADALRPD